MSKGGTSDPPPSQQSMALEDDGDGLALKRGGSRKEKKVRKQAGGLGLARRGGGRGAVAGGRGPLISAV